MREIVSARQVIVSVCQQFDLGVAQLCEKSNRPGVAFPRQFAAYLLREDVFGYAMSFTEADKLSLQTIGELLHQHHTTVLHSINKIKKLLGDPSCGPLLRDAIKQTRARYPDIAPKKASGGGFAKIELGDRDRAQAVKLLRSSQPRE